MPCPYFRPDRPLGPPRTIVPLGDLWAGECMAEATAVKPDENTVSSLCNLGYARGRCARYPENGGPDAVRFSLAADRGGVLSLRFAVERDYLPLAHGTLVFSRGKVTPEPAPLLRRQAEAYLESYLRRGNS